MGLCKIMIKEGWKIRVWKVYDIKFIIPLYGSIMALINEAINTSY